MILAANMNIKINLFLDGNKNEKIQKVALLLITIDDKLGFKTHIESTCWTENINCTHFKYR